MPVNVELTDQETRCLQRYFERVDQTEDLTFLHPEEYLAFQRIAGVVCSAGIADGDIARSILWYGQRDETANVGDVVASGDSRSVLASASPDVVADTDVAVVADSAVRALVTECIRAFDSGDPAAVLALFADDARAYSPFLGYGSARDFVASVVGSVGARLTLHDVLTNREGRPQAVGYLLLEGWCDGEQGSAGEVFYYVLNIDASRNVVRSMIVLDASRD